MNKEEIVKYLIDEGSFRLAISREDKWVFLHKLIKNFGITISDSYKGWQIDIFQSTWTLDTRAIEDLKKIEISENWVKLILFNMSVSVEIKRRINGI